MMSMRRVHLVDRGFLWSPLNRAPRILDREKGVLDWYDLPHRVCIYGCGVGAAEAPLDDPSWCVFGLNTVPPLDRQRRIRSDVWWDIHERTAQ